MEASLTGRGECIAAFIPGRCSHKEAYQMPQSKDLQKVHYTPRGSENREPTFP